MSGQNPDRVIDHWLRKELDAVPEPTRAVQHAIDAAARTPQRRGRWSGLLDFLGFGGSMRERSPDRPEVVLTPQRGAGSGTGTGALPRHGTASLPIVLVALALAVGLAVVFALAVAGPRWGVSGGAPATAEAVVSEDATTVVPPEAPLRPLDPPGPDGRVIVVDPARSGHFTTVGGAIAAAQPGDRIELLPGTYRESVIVRDDIVISGVGDRESIIVEPAPLPAGIDETGLQRSVFELHDSDARLTGFTVRGARHGSAIVVDGGAPTIEDMVVDPDADMRVGDPNHPHHSIVATSGASPIVRDSLITSLMWIHDGATPFLEGNVVDGACILVEGEGTAPTIRTTEFRDSGCPGFSISVAMGAAATIEAAHVYNSPDTAGIRVAGEGTTVQVSGSNVYGGTAGFIVGNGADLVVYASQVTNADTGIEIYDADVELATNRFERNTTGLEARGSGQLVTLDNVICDNQVNLDLRDGVAVPVEQNEICVDGSGERIAVAGT